MRAAKLKERPSFSLMKQTDIQNIYYMQMPRWLFSDPRYAGITRTADHVEWYENVCMLGVFLGSLACLYDGNLPFGVPGLAVYGLFSGIFLGSWIIALGEVVNVYAIAMRRLGIVRGIQYLILAMAAGKLLGSLLYFYRGW